MEASENTNLRLLMLREVADLLRVSTTTVLRLVKAGKLPPPARMGRSTRWREDQIIEHVRRLTQAPSGQLEEVTDPNSIN